MDAFNFFRIKLCIKRTKILRYKLFGIFVGVIGSYSLSMCYRHSALTGNMSPHLLRSPNNNYIILKCFDFSIYHYSDRRFCSQGIWVQQVQISLQKAAITYSSFSIFIVVSNAFLIFFTYMSL